MKKRIIIVQGGAYGSEAKGAVSLALCERLDVKWTVRTGSINAGHNVWTGDRKITFQQLPVGSVLPGVNVVIGPGAYVSQKVINDEVAVSGCKDRLILDTNCGVHLDEYTDEATQANRKLKIGATGKGCAEAILHKIKDRGVGVPLLFREETAPEGQYRFADTSLLLNQAYDRGEGILIEGTQGTLLDFHCGPYPFVTSRQTIAAAWVAEAGLSPALDYEICLVARTFPIRVAGNSGPMGIETSWPVLAQQMNTRLRSFNLPPIVSEDALNEFWTCREKAGTNTKSAQRTWSENALLINTEALALMSGHGRTEVLKLFEATTVTKRVRRIAELDRELLKLTVIKERPAYLALTFLNYVFPELSPEHNRVRQVSSEALRWVYKLQDDVGCQIKYASIGPRSEDLLEF